MGSHVYRSPARVHMSDGCMRSTINKKTGARIR